MAPNGFSEPFPYRDNPQTTKPATGQIWRPQAVEHEMADEDFLTSADLAELVRTVYADDLDSLHSVWAEPAGESWVVRVTFEKTVTGSAWDATKALRRWLEFSTKRKILIVAYVRPLTPDQAYAAAWRVHRRFP